MKKQIALPLAFFLFVASCSPAFPSLESQNPSENSPQPLTPAPFQVLLPNVQASGDNPPPTPADAPLTEWNTIPIMPGALAGEESNGTYIFITQASLADIKAYYLEQLPAAGWKELSRGEGPNHISLLFQKGEQRVTITIDFHPEQNNSSVTIKR